MGSPGGWVPSDATPPASLAALQSAGVTAQPDTKWDSGTYVVLGDGTNAYWDSRGWKAGKAPAAVKKANG